MGEIEALIAYGAVELAPLSPGFVAIFSLFQEPLRSWRPLMDLSSLNGFVLLTHFRMKSPHSVHRAV